MYALKFLHINWESNQQMKATTQTGANAGITVVHEIEQMRFKA
jgi:hypothetical protein